MTHSINIEISMITVDLRNEDPPESRSLDESLRIGGKKKQRTLYGVFHGVVSH
jgi:hypothetical protein